MITVTVYGLDQFVVGRMSKELTTPLAKVYETDEDNINFIAPNSMVFHKGVEQTSWNVYIEVRAPKKVQVLEHLAKDAILNSIIESGVAINISLVFYYFSIDNYHVSINEDYPRFISEENLVNIESEDESEPREEGEGDDQIYTGDIFSDFKKE